MKTLIILLFGFSSFGQATKKIIYSGKTFPFFIENLTDGKTSVSYFIWQENGFDLRINSRLELKNLSDDLSSYANFTRMANYDTRNDDYTLQRNKTSSDVIIVAYRGYFTLTKNDALKVASELNTILNLITQ